MEHNIREALSNVELALLASDPKLIADLSVEEDYKPIIEIANKILAGDYADALKMPIVTRIMKEFTQNVDGASERDAYEYINDNIEDYLAGLSAAKRGSEQLIVMMIGVVNLLVFIQANFTGPNVKDVEPILANYPADNSLRELTVDGEVIYKKLSYLQQLQLARAILINNGDQLATCASRSWWTARVALMQQHVMSGPCDTLRRVSDVNLSKAEYMVRHWPVSPERALFTELRARLFLEHGRLMFMVGNTTKAREFYNQARDLTGLVAELSGVHGKRTRFQEFTTPQLVVLATSEVSKVSMSGSEQQSTDSTKKLPIDVPHDHDVLLPRTDFSKADPEIKTQMEQNLAVIDQCILLAIIMDLKSTNPREELTAEQMTAYVNRLVLNPNNWMVHSTVLLLRSRIEADKSKTMDRAVLQLQSLVDQYNAEDQLHYSASQRINYIYSLPYPPYYKLKRELALQYLKLGLAKSALQLFEELELWSEIIQCYQVIGDQLKGQQVIQTQLEQLRAKRDNTSTGTRRGDQTEAELLCLMGDLTGVKDWYEQSWSASQQSYARAKRQLGHWWVKQGKFDEAIPHFEAALKINPQYPSIWFTLGFCCMHLNKLEMAQICFTRVVGLHPEDGESWNNLAAVCLKLKKYKEAYSALREALKYKNDSYRIWENYMFVSLKINQLQDAIYAYQRVLDHIEKHVDHEVLSFLVDNVVDEVQSNPGETSKFLEKQLAELFGRLTSQVSTDPELWGIYQSFHHRMGRAQKALDLRWKQLRSAQCSGWEQNEEQFTRVVRVCEELVQELISAEDKSGAYSLKLNLSSAVKKCRAAFEQHADFAALTALLARMEQFAG